MAIVRDATSSNASAVGATSNTFAHTCTGANRILIVSTYVGGSQNVTVTYAGVSMTEIGTPTTVNTRVEQLWYLIAPATGANNIVVSWSSSAVYGATAVSYTGTKQSVQPDATGAASTGTGASISSATTVVASDCWLVGGYYDDGGSGAGAPTAGASTTLVVTTNTANANTAIFDSNGTVATGSVSLTAVPANDVGTDNVVFKTASISPYVATSNTGAGFFMMMM